ncbi:MAG: insulinase family protein, partial [Nannocystaceae bacterium]|nr:insulinase family protein [Nannocystaceae bacterium]
MASVLVAFGLLACSGNAVIEISADPGSGPTRSPAYERFVLDNGLQVVLYQDHRIPLVAVNLTYHVGEMHDGAHPGLAHLVEHLMFRGTRNTKDHGFLRQLQDAGCVGANASTHLDRTEYYTVAPAEQLPLVLWLESDRMGNTARVLSKSHVSQEVSTTTDEWRTRVASKSYGLAIDQVYATLFPAPHPHHMAEPSEIARLQLRHATGFMNRYYGPANATLVLAGDLPANVRETIERAFARRTGGQRPAERSAAITRGHAERTIEVHSEFATTPLLVLVWPTPGNLQPDDAEARIVADALNAGPLDALARSPEGEVLIWLRAEQHSSPGQSVFTI